jgi:hypothetical protein
MVLPVGLTFVRTIVWGINIATNNLFRILYKQHVNKYIWTSRTVWYHIGTVGYTTGNPSSHLGPLSHSLNPHQYTSGTNPPSSLFPPFPLYLYPPWKQFPPPCPPLHHATWLVWHTAPSEVLFLQFHYLITWPRRTLGMWSGCWSFLI